MVSDRNLNLVSIVWKQARWSSSQNRNHLSTIIVHTNNFIQNIQILITNKWQLRWHQQWTSYSTKLNHIKHNTDNWTFRIEISRQFEVILSKLKIGCTQIAHSYFITKEEPPIFIACGVQVPIKNILTECQIHHNIRINHKSQPPRITNWNPILSPLM